MGMEGAVSYFGDGGGDGEAACFCRGVLDNLGLGCVVENAVGGSEVGVAGGCGEGGEVRACSEGLCSDGGYLGGDVDGGEGRVAVNCLRRDGGD